MLIEEKDQITTEVLKQHWGIKLLLQLTFAQKSMKLNACTRAGCSLHADSQGKYLPHSTPTITMLFGLLKEPK